MVKYLLSLFKKGFSMFDCKIIHFIRVFFLFLYLYSTAYAGYGVCAYKKEKLRDFYCNGPAILKETIVTEQVHVVGSLRATDTTLPYVKVIGSMEVKRSTIYGDFTLRGYLNAKEVQFAKDITLITNHAFFNSSSLNGNLFIYAKHKKPIITIICHSEIKGAITFTHKPGILQLTPEVKLTGALKNGSIQYINMPCE